MKFIAFQDAEDAKFYFTLENNQGDEILGSRAFDTRDECISAIRSSINLFPNRENFSLSELDGQVYFTINDGDDSFAVSIAFDSETTATETLRNFVADAADETYNVEVRTTTESAEIEQFAFLTEVDYHLFYNFERSSTNKKAGFETFANDGNYSFHYNDADGNALLYGRDFPQQAKRDKRIRSVIKAAIKEERYAILERDGKYYFILKEKNGQEIARSKAFDNMAALEIGLAYAKNTISNYAADFPEPEKKERKSVNGYFLAQASPNGSDGFEGFKSEYGHFFHLNQNSTILLYSQSYGDARGRENGIRSAIKNGVAENKYEIKSENNKYFVLLRAGNRQEIARSGSVASENEAKELIHKLLAIMPNYVSEYNIELNNNNTKTNTEVESFTLEYHSSVVEATPKLNSMAQLNETRTEDNYLHCDRYAGHDSAGIEGHPQFTKFQDPETDLFYFSYLDDDGSVIFRSEGYPTTAARDNGVDSVMRNMELEERYKVVLYPDGLWYVSLRAGNHQEIARSCGYESEDAASYLTPSGRERRHAERAAAAKVKADAEAAALAAAAPTASDKSREDNREEDNYLPCKDYKGHARDAEHSEFAKFQHENGEHYFVMYDDAGEVVWRSEGYPTTAARDNGVASVIKNRDLAERILEKEMLNGYIYRSLKAGNHQEIARSCPKKPGAAVVEAIAVAAPIIAAVAPEVEAEVVEVAAPVAEIVAPVEVAAPVAAVKAPEKEDDYLPCDEYRDKTINDKPNNVALFKHENGQFYFVLYNEDGSIKLRSEGFEDAKTRDEELSGVLKYHDNPEMYNNIEKGGYIIRVLKDKTGREVGRSCLEKVPVAAPAPVVEEKVAPVVEVAAVAAAVATTAAIVTPEPTPVVEETPVAAKAAAPVAKAEREDDYLACDEYRNKNVNDKQNNVALFKHNNGQYYFVMYNADGSIKLRSEGFESAKKRDEELSGVLKHHKNESMYESIERNGHVIRILKDTTGREVGRSCLEKIVGAAPAVAPIAAAVATAAAAVTQVELPKVEVPTPPAVDIPDVDAGGFKWWWLLLPLLLLGLTWFMCNKEKPKADLPAKPTPAAPAPVTVTEATTKTDVKSFLPVVLYFDNDQPDANTTANTTPKTYKQAYDAYAAKRPEFVSKGDQPIGGFFDKEVTEGMNELEKLAGALKAITKSGEKVNLKVKGFASPLAKGDYNKNLTGRRVSSIKNYLMNYDGGVLSKALTDGSIKLDFEMSGEDKSKGGVSDSAKDKKSSVFSADASRERRVEIVGIE